MKTSIEFSDICIKVRFQTKQDKITKFNLVVASAKDGGIMEPEVESAVGWRLSTAWWLSASRARPPST